VVFRSRPAQGRHLFSTRAEYLERLTGKVILSMFAFGDAARGSAAQ